MTEPEAADDLPALLARVQAGDEAALMLLLQRYEPRLRTAARVLLGPLLRPHLDSLDLVQSVHRILVPGLREGKFDFAGPEQLVAMALTVLRRKVAHSWRKLKSNESLDVDAAPLATDHADDDPARSAQARDGLEHLLSRVSEDERQLLELRLEGLSSTEIAARLGCDAHVLRARLSRLRQRLRDAGGPEWV